MILGLGWIVVVFYGWIVFRTKFGDDLCNALFLFKQ